MRTPILATTLLLATGLFAQSQNPIGYPYDTVRLGSGNLAPFGFSTTPTIDEARWQQLISSNYLPSTGCLVTGMTANCQNATVALKYTGLRVVLSHTTATTLGNSFSGNLPAPQTVLNGIDYTVNWVGNSWVTINFTTPFVYNGTDNLVVSITKIYDRVTNPVVPTIVTHQTTGSPHRTDLPTTAYSYSAFGGGASTTDVVQFRSSSVLSMRLLTSAQGTTTIASVSQPAGREFSIGTNARVTIWAATGTVWGTLIDTAFRTPISIPPIQGRLLVNPSLLIASGTTAGGSSVITFPIPNDPSLIGSYWVLQSATATPSTIALTNAVDFFVTM